MHNRVITGDWAGNDHGMTSYSLSGKTLGIVGLGNIGTLVAKRAEALGMKIVFSDPRVEESPSPGWGKYVFEELLAESDYVTFHVHLGPKTRNMINSENVALLRRRPFLVNVSRAELIDRGALLQALESQAIRGAAIDAQYQEPTQSSDELFSYDNVFFSPHVAGSTVDSYRDTVRACVDNIRAAAEESGIQGLIGEPN